MSDGSDYESEAEHKPPSPPKLQLTKPVNKTDGEFKTESKKSESKKTNKKGPGRPRKVPHQEEIPRMGLLMKPVNAEAYIEFMHDNPTLFKKIITFFKSTATHVIQFIFRQTEVIMYAKDHFGESKIRVRIDGTKINKYYCRDVLDIGVPLKDLEMLFNKVDRDYKSMILYSKIGSTQKNITLSFKNDMSIDEIHTIDLIGQYNHMDNEHEFIDEDYMIKFEWPNKYFRKTINDIRMLSTQLSITQDHYTQPLSFEYVSENKKVHSKYNASDPKKIKLESRLRDDDTFRIDIKLDHLKSISSSHIADDIAILIDENKKLMTKAYIDKNNAIEIKTITTIIVTRPVA